MHAATTHIKDEALSRGSLGPAALDMMTDVFTHELPRFPGVAATDEVADLVNEFFLDKGSGYANAVVAAPDDDAARRLTRKWAVHWLVDRARTLPFGALRNRLEKRLERSPLFARSAIDHYWRLADGDDADRAVTESQLRQLASSTFVETIPTADGIQLGRRGELEELLRRLLDAAGRLHISDITRICGERFPSTLEPGDAAWGTVDADWDYIEDVTPAADTTGTTADKRRHESTAESLMPLLSDQEFIIIRHADDAIALAAALGVGRSTAYTLISRLRARLVELAGDDEQGREVMVALVSLVLDDTPGVPSLREEDREDSRAI